MSLPNRIRFVFRSRSSRRETDRLERLVGDVLDLAKLQAHRFTVRHEEVDLERVLDQAYGAFTEEARRREIDYSLSGTEAAPVIVSDGDRVLQVITNLLSNAFRWTPDGGRIQLRLGEAKGAVSVDVVDSGPGVPPSQRARIFEAFVSQDADGTGLGLPIARELAVALGGRVELGSNAGAGSRFRLVLPVAPALCPPQRESSGCGGVRELALRHVCVRECFDHRLLAARGVLEALESRIDTAPTRAHEIDEQREVVDAGVSLGEEIALEPLEAANGLVEEAANLGDVPGDRKNLGSHAVANGRADVLRYRDLELGSGDCERLDLAPRALERGLDRRRLGSPGGGIRDSLLRTLEREGIHGREATLTAGWTWRSSITTFRASSSRRHRSNRGTRRDSSSTAAHQVR